MDTLFFVVGTGALLWFLYRVVTDPFQAFLVMLPFMILTRSVSLPIVGERITLFDVMLLLWFVGVALRSLHTRDRTDLTFSKSLFAPALFYYFFLSATFLSLVSAQDFVDGAQEILVFVFLGLLGVVTVGNLNSQKRIEQVGNLLNWILLGAIAFSVWEGVLVPRGLPSILEVRNEARITGTFRNPNQLTSFIVTILPFAAAKLFFAPITNIERWRLAFITSSAAVVVVMAASRTGLVLLIIEFGLLLLILAFRASPVHRSRLKGLFPAIALVTIGIGLVPSLAPSYWETFLWRTWPSVRTLFATGSVSEMWDAMPDAHAAYAEDTWTNAFEAFSDRPLTGVGIGNFGEQYTIGGRSGVEVHNQYMGILAETGIYGFVSFAIFFSIILLRAFMLYRQSKEPALIDWIVIAILVSLLVNSVGGVYIRILRQRWFWVVLSLGLAQWSYWVSTQAEAHGRRATEPSRLVTTSSNL